MYNPKFIDLLEILENIQAQYEINDRIVARYNNKYGDIYIITEYDRSYTTILFTNEY